MVPAFVTPLIGAIPPPPTNGFELGPLDVRLYGVLIALGAYLALRLAVRRYEIFGGDPELAEKAALVTLAAGFLGARLAYVLPRLDRFLAAPQDILAIWQGGLAIFGGITVGTAAAWWYLHHKGGDIPAFADAVAPAVPLAQAIGRWGNYFNQELYGRPTELPWALRVEPPFRRPGFEDAATFHPTFLYESLWNLALVVVILWLGRSGRLRRGSLGFVYLIGYGVGRFWVELLRIDTADRYLGLSRNSWVALAVILIGVFGLRWWERRRSTYDAESTTDAAPVTPTAGVVGDDTHGDDTHGDDAGGDPGQDRDAGFGTTDRGRHDRD